MFSSIICLQKVHELKFFSLIIATSIRAVIDNNYILSPFFHKQRRIEELFVFGITSPVIEGIALTIRARCGSVCGIALDVSRKFYMSRFIL